MNNGCRIGSQKLNNFQLQMFSIPANQNIQTKGDSFKKRLLLWTSAFTFSQAPQSLLKTVSVGSVIILNHFCLEEIKPGTYLLNNSTRMSQVKGHSSGVFNLSSGRSTDRSRWSVSCVFAGGTSLFLYWQSQKTLGRLWDGQPLSQR